MTKRTKKARFDGFFFVWSKVFHSFGYIRANALAKVNASMSESHNDCCSFTRGTSRLDC
ncbi:hypothetical protein E2N90_15365 [Pseudomonas syringae pv. tomato]|nr:hypothetical protein EIZ61_02040 [Pseudomonas syringae]TES66495.1 hypothetical protein E2N90_15365 [Pseudomonas syringae pv. tomato]